MLDAHAETGFAHSRAIRDAKAGATLVRPSSSARRRGGDTLDYYIIYSVGFSIFLAVALVQRLLPRRLRSFPCDPGCRRSPLGDARSATRNMIPFAFMG